MVVEFQLLTIEYLFIPGNSIHEITDIFQHIHPGASDLKFHPHVFRRQIKIRLQPHPAQNIRLHQIHLVAVNILVENPVKTIG